MDDKLLNSIISVAYGDASWIEKIKIKLLAKKRDDVRILLEEYKSTASKVKNIEHDSAPEEIIFNVKKQVKINQKSDKSIFLDVYTMIFGRPVFSGFVASIIILAIISSLVIKRPEIHKQYTQKEIQLADEQVKQSLALIAGVFNKTKSTVEKDVLTDRISKPLKNSITIVNEFFTGDKNEKLN